MRKKQYFWSKIEIAQINDDETNTFRAGLNQFSDFFGFEFESLSGFKKRQVNSNQPPVVKDSDKKLQEIERPDFIDWR